MFFKVAVPIVSPLLFIFWPLATVFYRFFKRVFPAQETQEITSLRMRDKILEILQDPEFAPYLDLHHQKLILSLVSFKEKIAREIMVPRIDMFALSSETTLKEAAKSFLSEGYSRIPVYQESVDNIIGVVYYKDILTHYMKCTEEKQPQHQLNKPIVHLVKSIVYTPETKPISTLLQEFRNKQIHMAIVVDEYGGTEGIVTIEDILEELVGEIADEYDREEEALYTPLPTGGWIIDAKMGIIDIEEELGVKIPESPEYDTLGGYIFHKAGTIPLKGWRLHHDEFDIEVLSSDERSIDKVRIIPKKS
jgi:CBS domain containing-hemolysin-like protein